MTSKKPTKADLAERDHKIVARLLDGQNLREVGEEFGLTRERVRQIAKRRGVQVRDIRESKRQGAERRFRELKERVQEFSIANPSSKISDIANHFGVDEESAELALENRKNIHREIARPGNQQFTDESIFSGLREWASGSEVISGPAYDKWAAEHNEARLPTVILRFGTWTAAMNQAGLGHLVQARRSRRSVSDEQLWAAVVQYYRSPRTRYSFADFAVWSREMGYPSADSTRARLGTWSEVRTVALQIIEYANNPEVRPWGFAATVLCTSPGDSRPTRISKEDCRIALRRVAASTEGKLTVNLYETERMKHEPSAQSVIRIFDGWTDAVIYSGLIDRSTNRRSKPKGE